MAAKKLDEPGNDPSIRRVLRHCESKAYFRNGEWTQDPEDAEHFPDVMQVAEACVRYGLSDVEVALRFQAANCDLFCTSIR